MRQAYRPSASLGDEAGIDITVNAACLSAIYECIVWIHKKAHTFDIQIQSKSSLLSVEY